MPTSSSSLHMRGLINSRETSDAMLTDSCMLIKSGDSDAVFH